MKKITLLVVMFLGLLLNLQAAEPINIGAPLPDVSAKDENGQKVSFKKIGQKGYLLIYFYPMAMTPGCTAQACSIRDSYSALQAKGVTILGVSTDGQERLQKFKTTDNLPFTLISDTDQTVLNAFGVPSTFGKASRQAYLFKDGVLVWRDLHASTSKQAEDVLGYINSAK